MPPAHYRADEHVAASDLHPSQRPAFSLGNRLARLAWNITAALLFRTSPRPMHAWRAFLLRCFGARLGKGVHVYPKAKVWAPWNLDCADYAGIGDGTDIYNPAPMHFGEFCVVSQDSFVCGATHDYNDPDFPLLAFEMSIGARAWICARACVAPGVQVGEGAVLGLASVATRDLEPWTVYGGTPAVALKPRKQIRSSKAADAGGRLD
ncbi:putative colanic acid biosynthesis acetyltransferase [Terriglobus sp.]|uniref:putative colanic acid biosynthesis acetyltransferase n=1 Tax=Terriglobus sp. TaxID=1889013 RepID=UPI003B00EFAA